jgi:hypothetical protein
MIEKRAKRMARSYEFVEQFESTKKEAIIAIVANDPSFLVHATLDELWEAILRRHAWHFSPLIMTAVTGMQVVMAVIPLLSPRTPTSTSVLVSWLSFTWYPWQQLTRLLCVRI